MKAMWGKYSKKMNLIFAFIEANERETASLILQIFLITKAVTMNNLALKRSLV
jgi:hypothetical protein